MVCQLCVEFTTQSHCRILNPGVSFRLSLNVTTPKRFVNINYLWVEFELSIFFQYGSFTNVCLLSSALFSLLACVYNDPQYYKKEEMWEISK